MRPVIATRIGGLVAAAAIAALVGGGHGGIARAASDPPLTTRGGAVAAQSPLASRAGAAILASGGNAIDAAVATALVLGVVEPESSGIGGGGFAVVYVAAEKKVYVYDFREEAPAALGPKDFVVGGAVDPMRSRIGGLAVGVPGELAGLARLSARHGRLSWRRVVDPALLLARDGFAVPWYVPKTVGIVLGRLPRTAPFDRLRALIAPAGAPLTAGDPIARPDLAATLAAVAAHGAGAFYRGSIADDIVATVAAGGGVMTRADLAGYRAQDHPPLWGSWHGLRIATVGLPSSGGLVLLEMLGILDRTGIDLAGLPPGSSAALQVLAEVMKHGFADRSRFLGDAAAAKALAARMLDPARLARMAAKVSPDHVLPHDQYGDPDRPPAPVKKDGGTSHLCVVDADGNAVSLTTTVNGYFGAGLVTRGGVVLNNEMDDFEIAPGQVNMFGLTQSDLNLVAGGKRPLSSMTPILVFDGDKVVACIGGAGGPMITSGTFEVLLDMFAWGMDPKAAVSAPRIHDQWLPDMIFAEPELAADVVDGLRRRGQKVTVSARARSAIQAIRVLPDGTRQAATDPRHGSAPAAAPPPARRPARRPAATTSAAP
jgi:gamma-glutamyltranspeptidase / glutathione hydrolase